jgi:phosphocarrier protein HPr
MKSINIEIINKLGLHARAATKLVTTASRFRSEIKVGRVENQLTNAKSIMGIMMLAASKGTTLILQAEGSDETEAIQSLKTLINKRFGEDE